MARLTNASPFRVALLLLLGLFVLDYVWVQTHPDYLRLTPRNGFSMRPGAGASCPDPESLNAKRSGGQSPAGQNDLGWKLRALDGQEVSLEAYRGKVVFVNEWATWCGPCVAEMPSIQALYDSVRKDGVEFIVASKEDPATVKQFVEEEKYAFPVFTFEEMPPQELRTRGIPATHILDRQGNIVLKQEGSANWDTESCRKFLRALL